MTITNFTSVFACGSKGLRTRQLQVHTPSGRNSASAPSADCLRRDLADATNRDRAAEAIDDSGIILDRFHQISVNQLTHNLQGGFRRIPYPPEMDLHERLLSPQDRIAWAIERAKRDGLPPEALAARIGISRPGMLHWTKETTNVQGIGIGPLMKFAQAAKVNLDWLMTGKGHPTHSYTSSEEVDELVEALNYLAAEEPAEYKVLRRMIRSAKEQGTAGHE